MLSKTIVRRCKYILAIGTLTDSISFADALVKIGAEKPFIIAESLGAGMSYKSSEYPYVIICKNNKAENQLQAFRNYRDKLGNLPQRVIKALNKYDPLGEARLLLTAQHHVPNVGGRLPYSDRPTSWMRLEDKTIADSLWDRLEIKREVSRVIKVGKVNIRSAIQELDLGHGVVITGDSREGYNSGCDYVRFVNDPKDELEATHFFSAHCSKVRVMPYLLGIPCSIHGMVFPKGIAVFRPIEMFIFRQSEQSRFYYAGNGTFWDPPFKERDEMRDVARRVGHHLKESVNYRGSYTVDGIITTNGFRPTELNTRLGAAFKSFVQSHNLLSMRLLEMDLRHGLNPDISPQKIENQLLDSSDKNRNGHIWAMTKTPLKSNSFEFDWVYSDSGKVKLNVDIGPSQVGGVVKIDLNKWPYSNSESAAPHVANLLTQLDPFLGSNFKELKAVSTLTEHEL